jgi:rhodanese-related sulfurtransferase
VAEFVGGHPKGKVVNVPVSFVHPVSKEVYANESFLLVMEHLYPKDTPLIAGCDEGGRAAEAARRLLDAGYTDISVMAEGFPGWRRHELPATGDNRDGVSYVSLLTRVKRTGKK